MTRTSTIWSRIYSRITLLSVIAGGIYLVIINLILKPDEQDHLKEEMINSFPHIREIALQYFPGITQTFAEKSEFQLKKSSYISSGKFEEFREKVQNYEAEIRSAIKKLNPCDHNTTDCLQTFSMDDGTEYYGSSSEDIANGPGIEKIQNSNLQYFGYYVNGYSNGLVLEKDGSGSCLVEYQNGDATGKAQCLYENPLYFFDGSFIKGSKNGYGVELHEDYLYEGNFTDDLREGKGQWVDNSGLFYKGDFKYGAFHGQGTWIRNNTVYRGELKFDLSDGYGTVVYNDGASYAGEWFRDLRHGRGTYTYKDGSSYTGLYEYNLLNDPNAVVIYPDGRTYNGGFKNDVEHGNAIETYKDGTVIKLSYKYGLRDGKYYERGPAGEYHYNYVLGVLEGQQKEITNGTTYEYKTENGLSVGKLKKTISDTKEVFYCDYIDFRESNCNLSQD